jgi:hypothetical protein
MLREVHEFLDHYCECNPNYTGSLEIHFKDGKPLDIHANCRYKLNDETGRYSRYPLKAGN